MKHPNLRSHMQAHGRQLQSCGVYTMNCARISPFIHLSIPEELNKYI